MTSNYYRFLSATLASVMLALTVNTSLAAAATCNTNYAFGCSLSEYVTKFASWAIGAGISIAIIMVIYAGYTMITSSGDPSKIGFAKEVIVAALTGIVFLAGAQLVLNLLAVG